MNSPYICLRCQQTLKLRGLHSQRILSRKFISLSTTNDTPREDGLQTEERQRQDSQKPKTYRNPRIDQDRTNDILENLFTSTNRRVPPPPAKSRYSNTLKPTLIAYDENRKLFENEVASLEHMLNVQRVSIDDIWAKIKQIQCIRPQQGKRLAFREQEILQNTTVFRDILLAVLRQKTASKEVSPVLKVADVIREYDNKGLMQDWWNLVFWNILGSIAEIRQADSQEASTGEIKQGNLDKSLLQEVLEVGHLYMKLYQNQPDHHAGKALPTVSSTRISYIWRKVLRMASVPTDAVLRDPEFSPTQSNQSTRLSALAVAMTYLFLQEQRKASFMRRLSPPDLNEFSRVISITLRHTDLSEVKLQPYILDSDLSTAMIDSLVHQWESLRFHFSDQPSTSQPGVIARTALSPISPMKHYTKKGPMNQEQMQHGIVRELQQAAEKRDISHASHIWDRFMEKSTELQHSSGNHKLAMDTTSLSIVFAEFIKTFTGLGQYGKAIFVWNTMIQSGFQPTKNHWIDMLKACVLNKDASSLRSIWRSMLAQNVRPNNAMWTVYIRGLILSRSWDFALSTLEEMRKAWLTTNHDKNSPSDIESDRPELQERYQPSMVPINTAIAGFIGLDREKTAHSVLKWATSQGLKPDTITYNILLRPAVRKSRNKEVARILSEMEKNDCQPDVATFTILLDGLFRNPTSSFQSQTPEQQEKAVSRIFEDMRDNGIVANTHTYGTILDSLLSPKQFNLAAAGAVFAHMMELGIKPSRDIYTILVVHHFSSDPPNLAAVDRLWERIQREGIIVDHVFYDRMIEHYSRIGEVEKALSFVRLMPRLGKTPGWLALRRVLDALVLVEEWDMIKDLVKDVVDPTSRFFMHGTRGWKGEDEFWALVDVLRARGLDLPNRPLPKKTFNEVRHIETTT